jgi:hypothetical protein
MPFEGKDEEIAEQLDARTCHTLLSIRQFLTGKNIPVPVTVAVRSEAWVLAGWLLGS